MKISLSNLKSENQEVTIDGSGFGGKQDLVMFTFKDGRGLDERDITLMFHRKELLKVLKLLEPEDE